MAYKNPDFDYISDFTERERKYIGFMKKYDTPKYVGIEPWEGLKDGAQYAPLWKEYQNWNTYGQRKGEYKPPQTWLQKRRAYMTRRYTSTPGGGFSGALGGAAVQRKKLLGA